MASIIGPFVVGTLYAMDYSLPFYVSAIIAFILFIVAIVGLQK